MVAVIAGVIIAGSVAAGLALLVDGPDAFDASVSRPLTLSQPATVMVTANAKQTAEFLPMAEEHSASVKRRFSLWWCRIGNEEGKKNNSFPLSTYIAPGGLPQDPGHAAESLIYA
ncbi:hypothetical protein GFY24_33340 [Nocardia sp. SYP-A9097]|uniref:hypothetical protein n=1 Tax=Nocardia sp. SYP-A9097 TaxID=2663237 RepID=UPI00129BDFA2|nr:hypothetical protein [Nocardia sp. SYP-A9097]MRH92263.1 hypothetical protein [Nocardia sp. SYP-A9097]